MTAPTDPATVYCSALDGMPCAYCTICKRELEPEKGRLSSLEHIVKSGRWAWITVACDTCGYANTFRIIWRNPTTVVVRKEIRS